MSDRMYFPAYILDEKKYKVFSGSKYWNKTKTGSMRFIDESTAQKYCDHLNEQKEFNLNGD